MTTLIERPKAAPPADPDTHVAVGPVEVITAISEQLAVLEVAQAYFSLGERPIPLCDANHAFVPAWHIDGYQGKYGSPVSGCNSPGKAPLEHGYPRFAVTPPSAMETVRMFGSHHGNIGGVVPTGRIVIDIDPRKGGLESVVALTGRHGPFPETPTVKSGGNGIHNYFVLPNGITVPSGGSLASSGYPGVEWKGPGGQVVSPPSVHESGQPYLWDPGFAIGEMSFAPIPLWLLQLILKQSASSDHLRSNPTRLTLSDTRCSLLGFNNTSRTCGRELGSGSNQDRATSCIPARSMQNNILRCISTLNAASGTVSLRNAPDTVAAECGNWKPSSGHQRTGYYPLAWFVTYRWNAPPMACRS